MSNIKKYNSAPGRLLRNTFKQKPHSRPINYKFKSIYHDDNGNFVDTYDDSNYLASNPSRVLHFTDFTQGKSKKHKYKSNAKTSTYDNRFTHGENSAFGIVKNRVSRGGKKSRKNKTLKNNK
jgi:hypothetical protein